MMRPSDFIAIIDTREQEPFTHLDPYPHSDASCCLQTELGTLTTGDYSVKGIEDIVRVERKNLNDLIGSITSGRDRFAREMDRLKAFPERMVVIEGSWAEVCQGFYRSRMEPNSAVNTIMSWQGQYRTPFFFAGSREMACQATASFLYHAARRFHERFAKV